MKWTEEQIALFKQTAIQSLLGFCVYTDKFFEVNAHHKLLANKLQQFMEWKIKRLILQTPPRSWKSRLICEAIAHWMWKLENTDIIYTGHSIWLLETFSRNIRGRIDSPEYKELFKNKIKEWNSAIQQWSTDNNNQLMIFGVWWGITGRGWHRLIIDDPYATRQDAESDTIRARVLEWYNSTFYSRRHNQDAWICLIMQRWREDDLVGEVIKQDDWEVVKIPAIQDGKSFWESRFSVPELENIRAQIWPYFFESQYQQDPINEWGWAFRKEYFQYYDIAPMNKLKIVTFVDPAISQKQTADNTAIVTIWLDTTNNLIYILDVFAQRVEPDELIDNLFRIVKEFWVKKVGIESVAFQKMLILEVKKQMRLRDYFFVLDEVLPMGEKEARIRSTIQPRYSNRSILHKREAHKDLELELLKFPNWKHDDMIDSLSWAVRMLESVNITQSSSLVMQDHWLDRFLQ